VQETEVLLETSPALRRYEDVKDLIGSPADREGRAVGVSPDSGLKYTSYFAEMLGDEGTPST
jgi:hypothetical protein